MEFDAPVPCARVGKGEKVALAVTSVGVGGSRCGRGRGGVCIHFERCSAELSGAGAEDESTPAAGM